MKLQFNLLPDVKQQYLKTKRTSRTVIAVSLASTALALFIFLFMLINVDVINKKKLSDADKSISTYSQQLKNIPNLNRILIIQSQLQSVTTLHQSKHITSRLYQYLPQITPSNVCLGQISLDSTTNALIIQGDTDTLKSINVFIDTLKFTTYKEGGQNTGKNAFPTVVERTFGVNSSTNSITCAGKPASASFSLDVTYDPDLFSNTKTISLNVPAGEYTTRSVLDDPSNPLFNGQPKQNSSSTSKGGQ